MPAHMVPAPVPPVSGSPRHATRPAAVDNGRALDGAQDDASLLVAVAAGDPAALGTLYERHARFAFGVAYRLVGDRHAAEDVVHDAFLAVWRGARSFQPARGGVKPWLLTVVRNTAIDYLRARRPTPLGDQEPPVPTATPTLDVGDAVARAAERERVRLAVADLPAAQRQAVHLAFFGGLTHAEIAGQTGLPLGTIKGRLRLALRKLRGPLGDLAPAAQ